MLELWFDFSCPYAYLASRRAARLQTKIDWRPMLLGGIFRGLGTGDGPLATLSPAKAAHNLHDMHRWADVFDEPFRMPAAHPMRTVRALRVLLALPRERWPTAIEALFAAYWQRGEDITRDEVIAGALRAAGVPADDVAAARSRADDADIKEELRRRTDEALALGIFGAPAWIARRPNRAPILVWGQDRLPWIEAILEGWDPDAEPPPGGPRSLQVPPAAPGAEVAVYYDASSPFAYLALTQLPSLVASGATLRLVPILLGAIFRELGQANVPLFAFPPAKLRYISTEIARWARWWGVPFDMPRKFPQRTITAQRLAILAADDGVDAGLRLAHALGRGMWAEQRDLEDEATLRAILAVEGFPAGWIERTQDPALKARLAANTAAAQAAGVFGVPTFIVSATTSAGPHLFWGQDRLELVGRALSGAWTPP
ncbi:MAG TPA: DsbA family protein [Kofleriaceae bacterium]|nr:DsbA family protein [Kofleriaceae bacterium]